MVALLRAGWALRFIGWSAGVERVGGGGSQGQVVCPLRIRIGSPLDP